MSLIDWATHVLQWHFDRKLQYRKMELIFKLCLSSDWSLQLDSMKLESLVIAEKHAAVNMFPGLVHTARQAMGVEFVLTRCANRKEADVNDRFGDWG
jgi:hypothetical protein